MAVGDQRQERLRERADGERAEHGTGAHRATEQPADREHHQFDPGTHETHRTAGARSCSPIPTESAGD